MSDRKRESRYANVRKCIGCPKEKPEHIGRKQWACSTECFDKYMERKERMSNVGR